jgi:hypothetical protein
MAGRFYPLLPRGLEGARALTCDRGARDGVSGRKLIRRLTLALEKPSEADTVPFCKISNGFVLDPAEPSHFALGYLPLFGEEVRRARNAFPRAPFFQLFLVHAAAPWPGFPSARFYDNRIFMKKSINDNQKRRGRPATGTAPMVGVRMTDEFQDAIKAWAKKQPDHPPLAVAIRLLVELGLTVKSAARPTAKAAAPRRRACGQGNR